MQGPSSTAAVYHFPARVGAIVTASAFAPCDDQGPVEQRVVDIARGIGADASECAISGVRD